MTRINAEKRYETIITASPTYCASLTLVSGESYLVRLTISATPTATRPKDIGLLKEYEPLSVLGLTATRPIILILFYNMNWFS